MIAPPRFSPYFKPLAVSAALAKSPHVHGAGTAESSAVHDPWAFNLTMYMWFQCVNGTVSAGPLSESVNASFVDIAGKLNSFPMAFNGHFEAHYERLGFYLDGNYLGLNFKPRFDRVSQGVSMDLGIMDYGATNRLFGSSAAEAVAHWDEKSRTNSLHGGGGLQGSDRGCGQACRGNRCDYEWTLRWFDGVLVKVSASPQCEKKYLHCLPLEFNGKIIITYYQGFIA